MSNGMKYVGASIVGVFVNGALTNWILVFLPETLMVWTSMIIATAAMVKVYFYWDAK